MPTARFTPDSEKECMRWLIQHDSHNLYYHVNETFAEVTDNKATKKEISVAHFLQIDVDLRVESTPSGAMILEGEKEGRHRITTMIGAFNKRPSALVYSGGGMNALWRLRDPVPMTADRDRDEIESRNKQLASVLDGDHTHDISRILRLPGTVNRLNAQKVEKGRKPSLSEIVWLEDSVYDLNDFLKFPEAARNTQSAGAGEPTESIEVLRVENVDDMDIPDKLKMVIWQGRDPDDPKTDRSHWLFWVCCELVRCNVSDGKILGIITDQRYAISASVLDKKAQIQRYALRQIRRAKDKAIDPQLMAYNDQYAVIRNFGGRCVVMIEATHEHPRTFQSPREFCMGRDNEKVVVPNKISPDKPPKLLGKGSWWFDNRNRRQYERVVFEPGVETVGDLNLWEGFTVEPKPGKKHESLLEHVFENICRADQTRYDYLTKWMARMIQSPNTRSEVAVVLLGDRGTGKSMLGTYLAALFGVGRHAFVAKDSRELTGRFNIHLAQVVFLLAEEAFDIRDRRHESVLKEIITGQHIAMEGKGANIEQMRNYVHLMMTSNNERVIPAGDKERRFLVMRVGDKKRGNTEYFMRILADRDSGGLSNLLHHLMEIRLDGWEVRAVPHTEELKEQQSHNMAPEEDWLLTKLENGFWLDDKPNVEFHAQVQKKAVYNEYLRAMKDRNLYNIMSDNQFTRWMKRAMPQFKSSQNSPSQANNFDRSIVWEFPPLEVCRKHFSERRGDPDYQWSKQTQVAQEAPHAADVF